ncbi:hypothetical protein CV102_10730 [Natronococcus pandeyae]|uniref:Uncharacterized protein n=1 Tax=Natronococcus pandeyae TaxID=2055836 RepID=A0A8J8Q7B7_9EURY|nr:hypothetical protein [Natronococcus pandeyae]TYL38969.1 hypothetical protein CV102_10730 [Natronococcus pandeyae]
MKRTLTIMMAVAMIVGLMFMGFAGTAAAQDVDIGLDASGGDGGDGGDATNLAYVDQANTNVQYASASASASGHHSGASAGVSQTQFVNQQNFADVDQTAVGGDGGDGGDGGQITDVDIDVDIDA